MLRKRAARPGGSSPGTVAKLQGLAAIVVLCLLPGSAACRSVGGAEAAPRPAGTVHYVGSSTVAIFLRAAEPEYGAIDFQLETEPESRGGEVAILEGRAQLVGVAREPAREVVEAGLSAALLGRDAIAVIVHRDNPITDLSRSKLRDIFAGRITSWREVGGPEVPMAPFIVGEGSATREIFRAAVLAPDSYSGCEAVSPDEAIVDAVARDPGAIGQISFAFLEGAAGVRAISVDGEQPAVTNFDYPVSRPLYLLWKKGSPVIDAFVRWTQTEEGQRVVMQNFVGGRVLASVKASIEDAPTGTLIVSTHTIPYYDGGIYYYPHQPYEILDREGRMVRRVRNHTGENDESPTRVELAPGTYLIRTRISAGEIVEFLAEIERGRVTELDVTTAADRR